MIKKYIVVFAMFACIVSFAQNGVKKKVARPINNKSVKVENNQPNPAAQKIKIPIQQTEVYQEYLLLPIGAIPFLNIKNDNQLARTNLIPKSNNPMANDNPNSYGVMSLVMDGKYEMNFLKLYVNSKGEKFIAVSSSSHEDGIGYQFNFYHKKEGNWEKDTTIIKESVKDAYFKIIPKFEEAMELIGEGKSVIDKGGYKSSVYNAMKKFIFKQTMFGTIGITNIQLSNSEIVTMQWNPYLSKFSLVIQK